MPEGDTIFRAARTLHKALAGKPVTRFEAMLARVAAPVLGQPLTGVVVDRVESRGKHCLIHFSDGRALRTHMRMNGSWHLYRHGETWRRSRDRARVILETADFVAIAFDVYDAELLPAGAVERHPALRRLGPDLLAPGFDPEEVIRRLRARPEAYLGDALLSQQVLAGIGNVFKSEVCFAARLHPFLRVAQVSDEDLRRVIRISLDYLAQNVKDGAVGITTYYGFRRTTGRSDPGERLWVYGRIGKPCRRCGAEVQMERRGDQARSTYYCPRCQPLTEREHARSADV